MPTIRTTVNKGPENFVYLASQSPRRAQLLTQLGLPFETLLPGDQEDAEALEAVLPRESPKSYVQRVTQLKLEAACRRLKARQLPLAPVLCADTTVATGALILGKPADRAQAQSMLEQLSGRSHRVLTAVAVAAAGRTALVLSQSQVTFAPMTKTQIRAYVASGEPMGKAGAYAVQGLAGRYIREIRGSYTGIMGLPLYETAELLKSFGMRL